MKLRPDRRQLAETQHDAVEDKAAPMLRETIEALRLFDAERLEGLAAQAHQMERVPGTIRGREAIELRALRDTLCELLRTTDANLRLLRQLREMRLQGLESEPQVAGAAPWAH